MFSQTTRIGVVVAAAFVLAACGSSPNGPQVASLGSATTTTTAAAGGGGGPGPGSHDKIAQLALQYSACMRSHGVKNFPDPQISGNGISLRINGSQFNRNSPVFQAAQKACQKYQDAGITAGGGGKTLDPTKITAWAACMRSHGLPHFPDPKVTNGAMELNMDGTGIDPQSGTFQNAMKACRPLNPGGGMMVQSGGHGGGG